MEESKASSAFTETFDSNLTTVLTTFLGFDECSALLRLNK